MVSKNKTYTTHLLKRFINYIGTGQSPINLNRFAFLFHFFYALWERLDTFSMQIPQEKKLDLFYNIKMHQFKVQNGCSYLTQVQSFQRLSAAPCIALETAHV